MRSAKGKKETSDSRRLLEAAFACLDDALLIIDSPTRTILECNPAVERVFGYSRQKLIGRSTECLHMDREAFERFGQDVSPALDEKGVFRTEFRMRRKDGSIFESEHVVTQILDGSGRRVAAACLVRDITARKRAERLLQVQRDLALGLSEAKDLQEMLRLCLDAALDVSGMELGGIYLRNERDGSLELAHHQGLSEDFVRATCRYPADSANARLVMEGRPVYTRHPELGAALTVSTLKERLRALAVIPIRWRERIIGCMNVASREVDHVPMPARTALEAISYQIGSMISRIRAEDALRESDRRYVMVQNLAHVGYWERDYIHDKAIWGDELHRIFGTDPADGAPNFDEFIAMIHPNDRERTTREFESVRTSGRTGMRPCKIEFRIVRGDGAERVILSKAEAAIAADGKSVNLRGTGQDITDIRDMEKRLSTISDAERASVQRDLHDTICQDLSGIAFLAPAAKEDLHENPREAEKSLDKIIVLNQKALEQAKTIARGLKPLSNQPDALERALTELAYQVKEIYGIPCRLASRKRVSIADSLVSTQLYLIAREAAINAVKHAEASEIHVALWQRGRTLTLRVMDDGKGFDQPEKVKGETSAGLKAMRNRAHLIGATLNIRPRKKRGTVVECCLGQASSHNRDKSRQGVTGT